jgi:hypothetical protein
MSLYYLDWQENNLNWEAESRLWEAVYIVLSDTCDSWEDDANTWGTEERPWEAVCTTESDTEGGKKNPYEDADNYQRLLQLQDDLTTAERRKKKRLIKVLLFINDNKYEESKTRKDNIKVNIRDVKNIAGETLKVKIEI